MREVSKEEALDIFSRTKEEGLVYVADNVKRRPSFVCHCCGLCVKKCQVDMITLVEDGRGRRGEVDSRFCLGCGVCVAACREGALMMVDRGERVITPDSAMEKYLMIAIEQGKLGNLLFDDFTSLPHAVIRNVVNAITRVKPLKDYLKKEEMRSRFLQVLVAR